MIVHNLNVLGTVQAPYKADTPLVINTYAVLVGAVAG